MTQAQTVEERLNRLRTLYTAEKQEHVFKWLDELNEKEKEKLCESLERVDVARANRDFSQIQEANSSEKKDTIDFFTGARCDASNCSDMEKYVEKGYAMIRQGKVGLLLMAGGQGTRLGSDDPKGMFDIGLTSHKSLFQLQAEQILKLQTLAGTGARIPWYLITSEATHARTVQYFKEQNYFGLDKLDIVFIQQGVNPCLTIEGKFILESKCKIAVAPNGNGGLHAAIATSGSMSHIKKRGVEYLHCYGVDNVLVKLADPGFVGFAASTNADCCNMVVLKTHPHEKVGVMCLRNGKPSVVEYSEITVEEAELRDEVTGQLKFSGGNIANHLFKVDFIDKVTSIAELPLHVAKKKIPHIDENGSFIAKPDDFTGIKMEMFVFDVFMLTDKVTTYAVKRETHFSAVKNAAGARGQPFVSDSPDTARRDFSDYCIALVEGAGGVVTRNDDDAYACFEISPLTSIAGEGLSELVKGKTFHLPCTL